MMNYECPGVPRDVLEALFRSILLESAAMIYFKHKRTSIQKAARKTSLFFLLILNTCGIFLCVTRLPVQSAVVQRLCWCKTCHNMLLVFFTKKGKQIIRLKIRTPRSPNGRKRISIRVPMRWKMSVT